ncbi:hypothetical protein ACPCSC_30515 [Streptomyces lavendulocolor]|uniref:hypothetical protein n=1 Tax=Streptomyces lavendulocolor TaxID=67316 RepID=UPI003C3087E0
MTVLTVSVDDGLAAKVQEEAQRHAMPLDEYVAAVLRASQAPGGGNREELALEVARGSFQRWDEAGRPEDGAMSMAEVFRR